MWPLDDGGLLYLELWRDESRQVVSVCEAVVCLIGSDLMKIQR